MVKIILLITKLINSELTMIYDNITFYSFIYTMKGSMYYVVYDLVPTTF